MPAVTTVGHGTTGICDVGLPCCPHGRAGTNGTGAPFVFIDGQPVHRVDDMGSCNCPHGGSFASTTGSSIFFIDGHAVTRIGDTTVCQSCGMSGSHVSGSSFVFSE